MPEPLVVVETLRPGVALLTLNRPDKRNALSRALMEQLCEAIERVSDESPDAGTRSQNRVMLLRGAGPAFCTGLDLREAAHEEGAQESARLVARTLQTLYESRLVTIAVVHGAALAGGAGLMTACDLVVAEEGTRIGYPEVRRGLLAALVSGLLCAQVPRRVARELLILGEAIDAERALALGLINRIAPVGQGLAAARTLAEQALLGGPQALVKTKQALNDFSSVGFREALRQALDEHLVARRSAEAREGLAAFLEKRPPGWVERRLE
jgi:methylglutaconyl-CoA hydratase